MIHLILSGVRDGLERSVDMARMVVLLMAGRGAEMSLGVQLGCLAFVTVLYLVLRRQIFHEKELSRTDPLTGVANYRGFLEAAETGLERYKRTSGAFTIAYIDLDNFKWINDQWGHRAGDAVLSLVARTIRKSVRRTDCVARLGGDEFAVLLFDTGTEAAHRAVRHVFEQLSLSLRQIAWPTTSSIGAIIFETCPPSIGFALRRADELMYHVKRAGKNNLSFRIWGQGVRAVETPQIKGAAQTGDVEVTVPRAGEKMAKVRR